jgi:hypothetical protein
LAAFYASLALSSFCVASYRFVFLDNPKDPTKSHPILYVAG